MLAAVAVPAAMMSAMMAPTVTAMMSAMMAAMVTAVMSAMVTAMTTFAGERRRRQHEGCGNSCCESNVPNHVSVSPISRCLSALSLNPGG
jgi:hypothetical protein